LVTDRQVRRLFVLVNTEKEQETAAAKAGMDAKTARKYRRLGRLPSEMAAVQRGRTRPDPFVEVWDEVQTLYEDHAGLEAKTVFERPRRSSSFCSGRTPGAFRTGSCGRCSGG
jgi:hypothetical protein